MIWTFEDFALDDELFELRLGAEKVAIRPQALDVLFHLVRHRDRVVTREELMTEVWKGAKVTATSIPQAVFAARRALGEEGDDQRFVETIRGRGYRFVGKVDEVQRAPAAAANASDFVGRGSVVERFQGLHALAKQGRGGPMLVAGAVGAGKTRTTLELAKIAEAHGTTVLFGRGYVDEGVPELWPWVQIMRAAATLDPKLEGVLEGERGEQFRLFDDVARKLTELAKARGSLLVILDDVHFADAGTLLLLKLVAQTFRTAPALVVATYRDAATATNPVLARTVGGLAREEATRCVTLEPLDEAAISALARATLGRTLPAESIARLLEKTSGTPLFVVQILHAMQMEAKLAGLAHGATSALLSLDSMREAVALHLAELSEPCRAVLAVAAAVGAKFSPSVVAKMTDRAPEDVLAILDEASTARVVEVRGKEARFLHVLVRDVLYKKLSAAERARLHHSAAKVLAERGEKEDARAHEERARSLLG